MLADIHYAPAPAALRHSRGRGASAYDAHAVLLDEVGSRLLERLDPIKISPRCIIEMGAGTGRLVPAWRARFPDAAAHIVEPSTALLQRASTRQIPPRIAADIAQLPLRASCADLLISNLGAYWGAPQQLLIEFMRVAAPGALLLLSTFGPDTLKEFRAAFSQADSHAHVMPFIDMPDLGGELQRAGFSEIVMQIEQLTLTFASIDQLTQELGALGMRNCMPTSSTGMRNCMPSRSPGLLSPRRWQRVVNAYPRDAQNLLPATFEIIYVTAWKPLRSNHLPDGRQVIAIAPYKRAK